MEKEAKKRKSRLHRSLQMLGWVILGIIGVTALALLFGYFVMILWNWLMPDIFGLTTITFWQAFGLTLLARLVFGGFKHHGHPNKSGKKCRTKFAKRWSKKSGKENMNHFEDYWAEEGERSFKEYVAKRKTDN